LGGYESQENRYEFENKQEINEKIILSIAKRGDFLPILLLLGIVSSLVGGAAGVAKAINPHSVKEELKRHNRYMEGHRVYFTPINVDEGSQQRKLRKIKKKLKI